MAALPGRPADGRGGGQRHQGGGAAGGAGTATPSAGGARALQPSGRRVRAATDGEVGHSTSRGRYITVPPLVLAVCLSPTPPL